MQCLQVTIEDVIAGSNTCGAIELALNMSRGALLELNPFGLWGGACDGLPAGVKVGPTYLPSVTEFELFLTVLELYVYCWISLVRR